MICTNAGHLDCIAKPQFQEEIHQPLAKHARH
jgi:hypothetical protein